MIIVLLLILACSCVRYAFIGTVSVGVRHVMGNAADMVVADG